MENNKVILVDNQKCNMCFKCISVCPVKICNDASGNNIEINSSLCLGCGACVAVCETGARVIQDDFVDFLKTLKDNRFIAIVAPAVASVFPNNYKKLNGYLKALGVEAFFDVSFGAELATKSYIQYIKKENPKSVITQPCPSLVNYIEVYKPSLIKYLAPVDSPMVHTIKYIREYYREFKDHKIVVLSPCVAKRLEFNDTYSSVYNVTFKSLMEHFSRQGIQLRDYDDVEYTGAKAERAVLFSSPGGLKRTVERTLPHLSPKIRKIEGKDQVYDYLDGLEMSIESGIAPLIVDCLNCEKGCNGGPGTGNAHKSIDLIESSIEKRSERNIKTQKKIDKEINRYWKEVLYSRKYKDKSSKLKFVTPSEKDLKKTYESMHKKDDSDIFNCTACGYGSCKEMAKAIYNGINKIENCYHYQQEEVVRLNQDKESVALLLKEEISKSNTLIKKANIRMESMEEFTSQQILAIEQSSSSIEQLLASLVEIAHIATSRKNLLDDLDTSFKEVGDNLGAMVGSVSNINGSISSIDEMNKLIEDVADRTNLLSMNAAIEAARAGQWGAGFAVVAGEIKKLADASLGNANKVNDSIKGITSQIKSTVDLSVYSKNKNDQMGNIVGKVKTSFSEISNSVEEVSQGSEEVSRAIGVMSHSCKDVGHLFDDVKLSMNELVGMIYDMENLLSRIIDKKEVLVN